MEKRLYELAERMDGEQAERFGSSFDDFEKDASLSEDKQERILSSVMRKAGYEMNSVINNGKKITVDKKEKETGCAEVSRFKKGSLIAACIAFLMAGSVGTVMMFGGDKVSVSEPLSQTEEVSAAAPEADEETEAQNGVKIPDITGMSENEALLKLKQAGFLSTIRKVYDGKTEEGFVIRTDPAAGDEEYAAGTEVEVYISLGKSAKKVIVPDVSGYTENDAIDKLVSEGFVPVIHNERSEETETGKVIRTEPSGEALMSGSMVSVYVSAAEPENGSETEIPDLTGMEEPKAIDLIKKSGLDYETVTVAGDMEEGIVVSQSIDPHTFVNKGSVLTIYVSGGKGETAE